MSEVRAKRPADTQQAREAREAPFTLRVEGEIYSGWKNMRFTRGLERATGDFELEVSERWALQEESDMWQITPGDRCEIQFQGETVLNGYVDAYRPQYDSGSHAIRLTGRSKTCDLVDCSVLVDGGQFKGMTIAEIARILARPFGVNIVEEVQTAPVPEVQVQQGETVFALIERLCRLQEILVTDNAAGDLVLTRCGSNRSTTALIHGQNILSASAELDFSKRFSEYIIKAQRPGNKTKDGGGDEGGFLPPSDLIRLRHIPNVSARFRERMSLVRAKRGGKTKPKTLTEIVGTARDSGVRRYRPLLILAEKQADNAAAAERADWEKRRRIGASIRATITVQGWRQDDGRLWKTNEMAYCDAPWLALQTELVIAETTFTYGDGGTITELNLTLPDAFLPDPKKRKGKADPKGKGKGKAKSKKKKGGGPGGGFLFDSGGA